MSKQGLWRYLAVSALAVGVPIVLASGAGAVGSSAPVDIFQLSLIHTHQSGHANSGDNSAWNDIGQHNGTHQDCDARTDDGNTTGGVGGATTGGNTGGTCANTSTANNYANTNSATVSAGAASATNSSGTTATQSSTATVSVTGELPCECGNVLDVDQIAAIGTSQHASANSGDNSAYNSISQGNWTGQDANANVSDGNTTGGVGGPTTGGNTGGSAANTSTSSNNANGNTASVTTGSATAGNTSSTSSTQSSTATVTISG